MAETLTLKQYARALHKLGSRALPFAVRATLNGMAFEGRKAYASGARSSMTLRNKWTVASMRVDKDRGPLVIADMVATLGSVEPYMATQEEGDTQSGGKRGVPIPARAPGRRKKGRKKPVPLKSITSLNRAGDDVPRALAANRYRAAVLSRICRAGGGVAFLTMKRGEGLYRVEPKGRGHARVTKLWDLTHGSVTIPRNAMLSKASKEAAGHVAELFAKAVKFQVKRAARL